MPRTCPSCRTSLDPEDRFCSDCGRPASRTQARLATRTCAVCHAPVAADDLFCGECGAQSPNAPRGGQRRGQRPPERQRERPVREPAPSPLPPAGRARAPHPGSPVPTPGRILPSSWLGRVFYLGLFGSIMVLSLGRGAPQEGLILAGSLFSVLTIWRNILISNGFFPGTAAPLGITGEAVDEDSDDLMTRGFKLALFFVALVMARVVAGVVQAAFEYRF